MEPHGDSRTGVDLCIVVPPFDQIKIALLGPAVLAAACRKRGLKVSSVFGSMMLAGRVGYKSYTEVARFYLDSIVGERLFRPYAYPPEMASALPPLPKVGRRASALHDRLAPAIQPFMDDFVAEILAKRPRIVAITSTFEQIMAGSAVAWRIKQAAPDICIVMGGANIADPMGAAFAKVFPWVDHFFSGEADVAFPEFCERLIRDGERPKERVIHCEPIRDMAVVTEPDYSDFMTALAEGQARGELPPGVLESLPMESSRGCWWGVKNHCVFCGLNGDTMDFRVKAPERALEDIRAIVETWNPGSISFTDNIMPLKYLETVLPRLAEWETPPRIFYEVKANLRYDQLDLMRRAGVLEIQPGIESFSTNVLKIMRKGISGQQNLVLLRSCRTLGIDSIWNIIYGFPGETAEDYAALPALMPALEHLTAPRYCVPIVIDRFSPHHRDPVGLGIGSYAPYEGFTALFPPGAPVMDLAYHFIGQHSTPLLENKPLLEELHGAVDEWCAQWTGDRRPPILAALDMGPGAPVVIADTRRIAKRKMTTLSPDQDAALRFFETPRRLEKADPALAEAVAELLDMRFLVEHESQILSVVARPPLPTRLDEARRPAALVAAE